MQNKYHTDSCCRTYGIFLEEVKKIIDLETTGVTELIDRSSCEVGMTTDCLYIKNCFGISYHKTQMIDLNTLKASNFVNREIYTYEVST